MPNIESAAPPSSTSLVRRHPFRETVLRARSIASSKRVGAVLSASFCEPVGGCGLGDIDPQHVVVEPIQRGTGYELLLALLWLETRMDSRSPVVFLPADHVVSDEQLMSEALVDMAGWICKEPLPIYLLGAVPEGPHNQLGYITPWLKTAKLPSSVYQFVEMPDMRIARSLINAGALWNTFIFGGTVASLAKLFSPAYDAQIGALRQALKADAGTIPGAASGALARVFERLQPLDFSRDILCNQIDRLNVLRLPLCGWWPLKSPRVRTAEVLRNACPSSERPFL